jgi:hypothetical protein
MHHNSPNHQCAESFFRQARPSIYFRRQPAGHWKLVKPMQGRRTERSVPGGELIKTRRVVTAATVSIRILVF